MLLPASFCSSWVNLRMVFDEYWIAYGGCKELIRSPYLQISILISFLCYGIWTRPNWWTLVLSIIPSILGYTIGGFAITTSVAITTVLKLLSAARKYDQSPLRSPLMKLGAAFVHFVLVQVIALMLAMISSSAFSLPPLLLPDFFASTTVRLIVWWLGFTTAVYAVMCSLATVEWIFRMLKWIVKQEKQFEKQRRLGVNTLDR